MQYLSAILSHEIWTWETWKRVNAFPPWQGLFKSASGPILREQRKINQAPPRDFW